MKTKKNLLIFLCIFVLVFLVLVKASHAVTYRNTFILETYPVATFGGNPAGTSYFSNFVVNATGGITATSNKTTGSNTTILNVYLRAAGLVQNGSTCTINTIAGLETWVVLSDPGYPSTSTYSQGQVVPCTTFDPPTACPAGSAPGFFWPFYPGQHISQSEDPQAPSQGCIVPPCTAMEIPSASSGSCMAKTCPEGQTLGADGTCNSGTCPPGETFQNNACYPSCSSTQQMINGVCVDNCPAGQQEVNGQCLPTCAAGDTRNIWGQCQTPCPEGQSLNSLGQCVASCPTGQTIVNGTCAPDCPSGQTYVNATCVPSCPTGQTYVGGNCTNNCPAGQSLDPYGNCQPNCPAGFTRNASGSCVPIQCAAGQTMLNGICTQNPNPATLNSAPLAGEQGASTPTDSGSVTGGGTNNTTVTGGGGVSGGTGTGGAGGTTGTNNSGQDPSIDNTAATCPAGTWCLGDGVCEAGEPSWSSDCAGPNYFEDRWQQLQSEISTTGIAALASLGNHAFVGGTNLYTISTGQFAGNITYDLNTLQFAFQIMSVIFQIAFAWISIKIILLKKD